MRRLSLFLLLALLAAAVAVSEWRAHFSAAASASAAPPGAPQFDAAGKLIRPEGYRRWVYVSSGFGMSYNPDAGGNGAPAFTNVFVNPPSYDYFLANGKWPDKTIFVLEEYRSTSRGSINRSGSYQQTFLGLDVEVKDEARFPDKWAYFGFDETQKSSGAMTPAKNACWNCHEQNAAVEHSFVQFYPELLKLAKEKRTIKPTVNLEEKK